MNRTERDALARWLEEIADKLDGAEAVAEEIAAKHLRETRYAEDRDRYPVMVGSLQYSTKSAAESIRAAIRAHLSTRRPS